MTVNEIKYAVFCVNWQPGCRNTIGQTGSGPVSQTKRYTDIPARNACFQRRISDCSMVFQINKYVNLACFLNFCKHIMVFLCFSRVKILHTANVKAHAVFFKSPSASLFNVRF